MSLSGCFISGNCRISKQLATKWFWDPQAGNLGRMCTTMKRRSSYLQNSAEALLCHGKSRSIVTIYFAVLTVLGGSLKQLGAFYNIQIEAWPRSGWLNISAIDMTTWIFEAMKRNYTLQDWGLSLAHKAESEPIRASQERCSFNVNTCGRCDDYDGRWFTCLRR